MRRPVPAGLVACLLLSLSLAASPASAEVKAGDRAPELDGAKDGAGKAFRLKTYRGRWVVMTFGASWCKPCKKELPAWDKLAAKWGAKVAFVAVNVDNDPAKGKKFMDGLKIQKMVRVFAPEETTSAADVYAPPKQPTTYVIDPKGIVRERHEGYEGGDEKTLDRLLGTLVK